MELYQLKAFAAVAEHGNVTRAAEHLFTSQPAVSAQIKALEREFGVALFDRTPTGMALTHAGKELLEQARNILDQARATRDLARHLRDGTVGRLRIGLNDAGPRLRVDALSRALLQQHPELSLEFVHGTTGSVRDAVRRYDVDAGFIEGPCNDPALVATQIGVVELCIVLPNDWAQNLPEAEDWQALAKFPWVFTSPGCSYNVQLERLCKQQQIAPQKQFRLDHESTSLHMVRQGLAVSMVDRACAQPFADAGELTIWPHYEDQIPWSAVFLKKRQHEPGITAFRQAVAEVFEDTAVV
ncbi:MAG: LysR family transcriptional regulator [Phycisphaerales bacterium JB063]